jgi:apolipoprotein N-acyltransferase
MQANAAVGIYGVTLLTLLWAVLPYLGKRWAQGVAVVFVLITGAGAARLYLHPTQPSGSTVRIVQTNIPQSLKWSKQEMWNNFEHNLHLTSAPVRMPITFTIWPETAVMSDLATEPDIAKDIAAHLPKGSIGLIGTLRVIGKGEEFYNSVTVLNDKAQVLVNYNKYHLVPFGEYIPFRKYVDMTPIGNGVADIGDFTRGPGVTTLHLDHLPNPSPLVCYEAIFPGAVARLDDRPDWLLNVTNDGWYGKTAGPHQHFENARVRAVEEGLPLVRAANTGISATIDPLGRIIGLEPLYKTGVVDTILPAPLPPTLYARFGDTLFFLMLVLLGIAGETLYRKEQA